LTGTPSRHLPGDDELNEDDSLCEPRGLIPVKGKGEMETHILVGERASITTVGN
jgi:hypothetical protein